jgi:hypothetical protein
MEVLGVTPDARRVTAVRALNGWPATGRRPPLALAPVSSLRDSGLQSAAAKGRAQYFPYTDGGVNMNASAVGSIAFGGYDAGLALDEGQRAAWIAGAGRDALGSRGRYVISKRSGSDHGLPVASSASNRTIVPVSWSPASVKRR